MAGELKRTEYENIALGFKYYLENFFVNDCIPKYYDKKVYPIDATACGQALLTLCRFGELNRAQKVATWTIQNMQIPNGGIRYQWKSRRHSIDQEFMRWSNAFVLAGLAEVLAVQQESKT